MGINRNLCFALSLISVFVLCTALALATKDPDPKQCKHHCKVQQQFEERQKERCRKKCNKYYKENKQREREQEEGRESEEEEKERGGGSLDEWKTGEPEEHLRQCQRQCDRQEGGQQTALCRLRCQDKYRREKGEEGELYNKHKKEREEEDEDKEQEEENPYVFEQQHFTSTFKSEAGGAFLLPKFTQRSKLLRALENYRLGILVANPQTFLAPNHMDADAVFLVTWGRGTITMIHENNRVSVNVERGDLIKVPAGTHFYLVNRDDNEKLYIVKFVRPVNFRGDYVVFHGAGGFNPDSFFRAFSYEILEAAFKSTRDKVDRLFSRQGQGLIMKATREQIQALSQGGRYPSIWPFAGWLGNSINLFRKPPKQANYYGQLFEVNSNDYRPLQDLDMTVSYANMTKGSMSAPFYNSRATKVALVVAGEGHVEIARPHVSRGSSERPHQEESKKSQREMGGTTFHQVRARIKTDTVIVVPAGHPFVTVASKNSNLEIACFDINAKGNIRYTLAGRGNIFNFMEREAKELAFRTRSEEVDQMFGNQEEEFFFPGPTGPHEEGRAEE